MSVSHKPQLAFAWMGHPPLLEHLWTAMKTTVIARQPPRELMPKPSIYAAESEVWNYRFSRCVDLQTLLDMRMHARRPSGVLWCRESSLPPNRDELQMLLYAGGCKLPLVLVVYGLEEATEQADAFEQQTRELLEQTGVNADEAIFVYAKNTPSETLLHLYTRLDDSLSATPETNLPPMMAREQNVEALAILKERQRQPLLNIPSALLRFPWAHNNPSQETKTEQIFVVRQLLTNSIHAIVLRLQFDEILAFRPEQTFQMTLHISKERMLIATPCVIFV